MLFTEGPQELGQPIAKVHSLSLRRLDMLLYLSHITYVIKILGYAQHAAHVSTQPKAFLFLIGSHWYGTLTLIPHCQSAQPDQHFTCYTVSICAVLQVVPHQCPVSARCLDFSGPKVPNGLLSGAIYRVLSWCHISGQESGGTAGTSP